MIELYLSNDGEHTVHVSADTPEELAELAPKAKAIYEKIIASYSNKAQMWRLAIDREPAKLKTPGELRPKAESGSSTVPICPTHKRRMKLHHSRYGDFWSCNAYSEQRGWCKHTVNIPVTPGVPSDTA